MILFSFVCLFISIINLSITIFLLNRKYENFNAYMISQLQDINKMLYKVSESSKQYFDKISYIYDSKQNPDV